MESPNKSNAQQNLSKSPKSPRPQNSDDSKKNRSILETVGKGSEEIFNLKRQDLVSSTIVEFPIQPDQSVTSATRYLDLSNIRTQTINFNIIPQNIVVLRLTGTKIPKLESCPLLNSLRTLYLDSCNLSTLEGMPRFPKLRYLYLNDNNLTSYKGMPILPELVELNCLNNKVEFDVVTALQASGSIGLANFNGAAVTVPNIRAAFTHSPLVGVALRDGLNPSTATNDDALDFMSEGIVNFLVDKGYERGTPILTYTGSDDEGWFVVFPFQLAGKKPKNQSQEVLYANDIKWWMNTCPITSKGEEWELITQKQLNMIPISETMFQHIIKATFRVNDSNEVFSLYTDNVIGYKEKTLMLPFPVTPRVSGEPREGSLVSTIPMPVPTKSSWYIGDECILEDAETLTLTEEHIGKEITCAIQPFCPDLPQVKFNELITKTETVIALPPSVKGVIFPDSLVEGEEFHMSKQFTPNREGKSRVSIERAHSASDDWQHCAFLNPSSLVYTPKNSDVGCFLRLVYEPVLNDGTSAEEPFIFYSKTRVVPTIPSIRNAKLAGDFLVGRKVIAIGDYMGGRKGECIYQWYTSSKPFKSFSDLKKAVKVKSSNTALFEPRESDVDRFLACAITPIRDDDVVGDLIVATSANQVKEDLNPPEEIDIPKKILAFKPIHIPFDCNWFVTSTEDPTGFETADSGVGPEFTPNDRHIGRFIRITKNNDPDTSYVLGQVFSAPSIASEFELEVTSPYDTGIARIPDEVTLENFEVVWIRTTGKKETVVDVDTRSYTFTEQDIGSTIKVALTHVTADTHERGATTYSKPTKQIGKSVRGKPVINGDLAVGTELTVSIRNDTKDTVPIVESCRWYKSRDKINWTEVVTYSFYRIDKNTEEITYKCTKGRTVDHPLLFADLSYPLTESDVDYYVRVQLTLGEFASSAQERKTKVRPTDEVLQATHKDRVSHAVFKLTNRSQAEKYYEGKTATVSTQGVYKGDRVPTPVWERLEKDEHDEDQWVTVATGASYKFTADDVDQVIRCRPFESRKEKKPTVGSISRLATESFGDGHFALFTPILPRPPQVTDVEVDQNSIGQICIRGNYRGGTEGYSHFFISYIGADQHTIELVRFDSADGEQLPDGRSEYRIPTWNSLFDRGNNVRLPSVKIDAAYQPVRDDGTEGVPVWSSKSVVVYPQPTIKKAHVSGSNGDHFCVGDTLTCIVTSDDAKRCEFEWVITRKATDKDRERYKREKEREKEKMSSSGKLSPAKQSPTSTVYDEQRDVVVYTIKRAETPSYTVTERDIDAKFRCTVWALASNGFESEPFTCELKPEIGEERREPQLIIQLSQDDARHKAQIRATRRAATALARSERGENDFYVGDFVSAVFENADEQDVHWRLLSSPKDTEGEYFSSENTIRLNQSYVGLFVQVVSDDETLQSAPIGPIQTNSGIESLVKAASRANTFKFKGTAAVGNGNWECQMSEKGFTICGRNKVTKKTPWEETNFAMCEDDQLEITNGPGLRYIMVPALDERDKKDLKSTEEIRDFIYSLYNIYKNKKN